jgi:hypothetical protein
MVVKYRTVISCVGVLAFWMLTSLPVAMADTDPSPGEETEQTLEPDKDLELQFSIYPAGITLGIFITDSLSMRLGGTYNFATDNIEIAGIPVGTLVGLEANLNLRIAYEGNIAKDVLLDGDTLAWNVSTGYTLRTYTVGFISIFGEDVQLASANVFPLGLGVTHTWWALASRYLDLGLYTRLEGGPEFISVSVEDAAATNPDVATTASTLGYFVSFALGVVI